MNLEHARAIGEKLRSVRQSRQMSLRQLAKMADISPSMLSQIETGKAYPSVRSIYNIAAALSLPVDYFFPDNNGSNLPPSVRTPLHAGEMTASEMREATVNRSAGVTGVTTSPPAPLALAQVVHASARPTIVLKGGVTWSRLTAAAESDAEFLEITYTRGATSGENLSHHEGREFGLILEGELVVQLGFQQITLQAGDSIVFDSTTPHRLTNNGTEPMRALWVVWNHT
jgi:transcriptional regulator with XRE-family HTH domain/quercetin dioxygenase-like cupin family protein